MQQPLPAEGKFFTKVLGPKREPERAVFKAAEGQRERRLEAGDQPVLRTLKGIFIFIVRAVGLHSDSQEAR